MPKIWNIKNVNNFRKCQNVTVGLYLILGELISNVCLQLVSIPNNKSNIKQITLKTHCDVK